MAGLQDIASELGVSVSLVSKVLNNRFGTTGASPDTIQAIRARAKKVGYRKNLSASALATGRQNAIGVFIHQLGTAGSGLVEGMLQGISDVAVKLHQRLILHFFETAGEFTAYCRSVDQHLVDGVIIGGVGHPELVEDLVRLQKLGVPVVTIHDQQIDPAVPNVDMDQVEVCRLSTAHLIEQGCRRIAHVKRSSARLRGYELALRQAGYESLPELVHVASSHAYPAGQEAVAAWLGQGIEFDGVVAQSDQQAVGVIHALLKAGRRVPQDVKVIGVDNSPYCDFCIVPLSSVSQEMRSRGREAVRVLLANRDGEPAEPAPISPVLHARQSSANL